MKVDPGRFSRPGTLGTLPPMEYGAIALFGFVASITPGPNNVMLWASGLNYGFRRTIPHIAGINIGFVSLLLATSFGLGALFQRWEWMSIALRILGSAYLLYLAYRVATAGSAEKAETSKPLTFWEAAAFQYVNPKAWVMTVTAAGSFLPPEEPLVRSVLLMTAVFGAVNLPSIIVWAGGGTMMGRLLSDDRTRRIVNGILGLLLVWTVWLINQ